MQARLARLAFLESRGRGKRFTARRGAVESILRAAYAFDWPARAWGLVPGACDVRVERRVLRVLPPRMPSLRVAFASDLHLGPTTPDAILVRAENLLREARPDVLLLGGDYVFLDATPTKAARLAQFVRRIEAPRTLAVMGNHDLWTEHHLLEKALEAVGAEVLVNDGVRLEGAHDRVLVGGIDDPWTGSPDASRAFRRKRNGDVAIAFSHAPEALPLAQAFDPVLLVCGHTHGGHVALPGGIPIVAPGPMSRKHHAGSYHLGTTELVVSRGLGGIEVAFRLFAPPDVVIVDLLPSAR